MPIMLAQKIDNINDGGIMEFLKFIIMKRLTEGRRKNVDGQDCIDRTSHRAKLAALGLMLNCSLEHPAELPSYCGTVESSPSEQACLARTPSYDHFWIGNQCYRAHRNLGLCEPQNYQTCLQLNGVPILQTTLDDAGRPRFVTTNILCQNDGVPTYAPDGGMCRADVCVPMEAAVPVLDAAADTPTVDREPPTDGIPSPVDVPPSSDTAGDSGRADIVASDSIDASTDLPSADADRPDVDSGDAGPADIGMDTSFDTPDSPDAVRDASVDGDTNDGQMSDSGPAQDDGASDTGRTDSEPATDGNDGGDVSDVVTTADVQLTATRCNLDAEGPKHPITGARVGTRVHEGQTLFEFFRSTVGSPAVLFWTIATDQPTDVAAITFMADDALGTNFGITSVLRGEAEYPTWAIGADLAGGLRLYVNASARFSGPYPVRGRVFLTRRSGGSVACGSFGYLIVTR